MSEANKAILNQANAAAARGDYEAKDRSSPCCLMSCGPRSHRLCSPSPHRNGRRRATRGDHRRALERGNAVVR